MPTQDAVSPSDAFSSELFAERLAAARKAMGLSQAEVGRRLNIKGDSFGRYERGEVTPSIETAARIASALNVSLDYLAGRTDRPFSQATLRRINAIEDLPETEQQQVYRVVDALIRDAKTKDVYLEHEPSEADEEASEPPLRDRSAAPASNSA